MNIMGNANKQTEDECGTEAEFAKELAERLDALEMKRRSDSEAEGMEQNARRSEFEEQEEADAGETVVTPEQLCAWMRFAHAYSDFTSRQKAVK